VLKIVIDLKRASQKDVARILTQQLKQEGRDDLLNLDENS
jgi:hypothetical protein